MASREKNLVLNITGNTADVESKIKTLTEHATDLGTTFAKVVRKMSADSKKLTAALSFKGTPSAINTLGLTGRATTGATTATTEDFAALERKKTAALKEETRKRELIRKEEARKATLIKKAAIAEQKALESTRLTHFKSVSRNLVQEATLTAKAVGEVQASGANSALSKRKANAIAIFRLEKQLQKDLDALATKFAKGNGKKISGLRSQLIKTFQKETAEIHRQNSALDATKRKTQALLDPHKHWIRHVTEIVGIYRLVNFGINTIIQSIKAIPEIGINLQTTEAVLESTLGSGTAVQNMFKLLDQEAERAGLSITSVRENFRNLNASMSLAGESTQTVLNVFRDLNTVSTTLHLSADKTQGLFLAIAQIFNKTKVQSEELVKQLGNLLPGAFASFATAIGKSTLELVKEMQAGTVAAHENVEKFADFLAGRFSVGFAVASQGLQANIQRMDTAFTHLGEAIFKFSKGGLIAATKAITAMANAMTEAIKVLEKYSSEIQSVLVFALASLVGSVITAGATMVTLAGSVAQVTLATSLAVKGTAAFVKVISFFLTPARIIAALIAIGYWISQIGEKSDAATERVKELLTEEEKHLKMLEDLKGKSDAFKLDLEVRNLESIKETTRLLAHLQTNIDAIQAKITKADPGGFAKDSEFINGLKAELVEAQTKYDEFAAFRLRGIEQETAKILKEKKRQLEAERLLNEQLAGLGGKGSKAAARAAEQLEQKYQQALQSTREILAKVTGDEKGLFEIRLKKKFAAAEEIFTAQASIEVVDEITAARVKEAETMLNNIKISKGLMRADWERLQIQKEIDEISRRIEKAISRQSAVVAQAAIIEERTRREFERGYIDSEEFAKRAIQHARDLKNERLKLLDIAEDALVYAEDKEAAALRVLQIENDIVEAMEKQLDVSAKIADRQFDTALGVIGGESVRNVETDQLDTDVANATIVENQAKAQAASDFLTNLKKDEALAFDTYEKDMTKASELGTAKRFRAFGDYALGVMDLAADVAMAQTSAAIQAYGAESKQAKKAFAQYKAIMIAKTIMATALAVMDVWSKWAALPVVAGALTAIVVALGAVQVVKLIPKLADEFAYEEADPEAMGEFEEEDIQF